MIYLLLVTLLINTICYYYITIPGEFDDKNILDGYITPENNLLIFIRNNSKNILYKYEKDSDSVLYTKYNKLELMPFPLNYSGNITNYILVLIILILLLLRLLFLMKNILYHIYIMQVEIILLFL